MTEKHLKSIDAETLRQRAPIIREAWRTDNLKVFLGVLIKDSIKEGIDSRVVIASSIVLISDWLNGYLEKHQKAKVFFDDSTELIESLLRESITLALEIS